MTWLKAEHPVYTKSKDLWTKNERRLKGGDEILIELVKFDWELAPGTANYSTASKDIIPPYYTKLTHYEQRQAQATYVNFPDLFATVMVGHLMKEAPQPGFGTLGEVKRERNSDAQTEAEMVYYNVDGVGNDGSQWHNFWAGAVKRAMATGHRWIMVDAAARQAVTRADILNGARPYLVEYSPLNVHNWHYEEGRLAWAFLSVMVRNPQLVNGSLEGNEPTEHVIVMVRRGYLGFGPLMAEGGWWLFKVDNDDQPIDSGNWNTTGGEIPMFPLFYERDRENFSRPALTELGNVAVSYMNQTSAADFDAWDAASSFQWLIGVDEEAFNTAMEKIEEGSRFVPLDVNRQTEGMPSVHDGSNGATVASVFDSRLRSKREEARELAALESTSVPDSSGASKRAGFSEAKAPRLALIASELEQAQNTSIHFLERRFGNQTPTGAVSWPRNFELMDLVDKIQTVFTVERLSGYRSKTIGAKGMTLLAQEKGLISSDEEFSTVEAEYKEAADAMVTAINEGRLEAPDIGSGGTGQLLPRQSVAGANGRVGSSNTNGMKNQQQSDAMGQ